tara:strand:+ start:427 stop:1680 length:1254 start_codon:yes stop_codon:yes gene_type:complete
MSKLLYQHLADHKLFNKSVNFGLKRIKYALKLMGNPENKLKNVINILGESGKFTTLWTLKNFIEANNQTVSCFISPSLQNIRERFYLDNRYLTNKEIKDSIKKIEKLKIPLTVFEVLFLVYIINASKKNVDYSLCEVGALFRLDATNVWNFPLAQVVTNINLQHKIFLKKKTLNEIIKEDTGYLSNFSTIFIGKQTPLVLKKVKDQLKKNKSKIIYPNTWKLIKIRNSFYYQDKSNKIKLNNKNIHSRGMKENVCLAIKVALDLNIKKKIIKKTIPKLFFNGRFHYLKKGKIKKMLHKNESIMIDGGHAPADSLNLLSYLKTVNLPIYGVWAMSKNKEPDLFIKNFKGVFKKIVTIPIENDNSVPAQVLNKIANYNKIKSETAKDFIDALKKISSGEKKLILCFGSLFLMGLILNKN